MADLWKYQNKKWVKVKVASGDVYEGYPIVVNDADETESGEVEITLENHKWNGPAFVGLKESDILSIEEIGLQNRGRVL